MNINSHCYIHDTLENEVKPAFSRIQTSTDLTAAKLFSRNREGMFQQDGALVRIYQRLQSPGWTQILNTTFRRRTGRLIHRICLRLRMFGALWQQPFMPTRASVTASIEAPSPKSMEINFSVNTSKFYRFDA